MTVSSKKEKGLMDMENSVVIAGGRVEVEESIRVINGNRKLIKINY